jgi:hypothetical protein
MVKNKVYFFRDINHQNNLQDGKSFNAYGLAKLNHYTSCALDKKVVVDFFDPITLIVMHAYRSVDEIEVFDATEYEIDSFKEYLSIFSSSSNYKELLADKKSKFLQMLNERIEASSSRLSKEAYLIAKIKFKAMFK